MRTVALALIATFVIGAAAQAQDDSKTPARRPRDATAREGFPLNAGRTFTGNVFVGERAPDFMLDDHTDQPRKLSKFRGTWVLLVFADRGGQTSHLRRIEAELETLGARLLAVCHQKSHALRGTVLRDSVRFTVLSDPTGEIAAQYGLYDHKSRRTTPGYFVLDRGGVVRLAVLGRGLPADDVARFARFAITGL